MKLTFAQQAILLVAAGFIIWLIFGFGKVEDKIEDKTIVTMGSDIEIQYSGGQAFYVLRGNDGPVAFIKK